MAKAVKVDINFDSQSATISLKKMFNRVLKSKALNKEIGTDVVKSVKAAARLQKPLNNRGSFPDLKPITIANRKYLQRFNKTGSNYNADKANVTFTGQLLESLTFTLNAQNASEILFRGARKPYKTGPGSTQKNVPDNAQLASWLAEKGFIVFTAKGINSNVKLMKRINSKVKKYLRRALQVRNKLNQ